MTKLHVTFFPAEQMYSVWTEDHKLVKEWFHSRESADAWIAEQSGKILRYKVQLIWNRSFNWSNYTLKGDLSEAKTLAQTLVDLGDGACVRKVRIIDILTDEIVYKL